MSNITNTKIKESVCNKCFKVFKITKENINNYRCPLCMRGYSWKQWKGFKRLHAIKQYKGFSLSICGFYFLSKKVAFIEPTVTDVECKNCKRELNKALIGR